jgi:hypothetical protein
MVLALTGDAAMTSFLAFFSGYLLWKKDMKYKDHWDVMNPKTGKKIKEIDLNGNKIWPQGAKNKSRR